MSDHMPKCVVIEFLQPMSPYNPGETAGFPEVEARRYLAIPGLARERKDIEGKFATRSPGLDPPNINLQALAGAFRAATEEHTEQRRKA